MTKLKGMKIDESNNELCLVKNTWHIDNWWDVQRAAFCDSRNVFLGLPQFECLGWLQFGFCHNLNCVTVDF